MDRRAAGATSSSGVFSQRAAPAAGLFFQRRGIVNNDSLTREVMAVRRIAEEKFFRDEEDENLKIRKRAIHEAKARVAAREVGLRNWL